MDENRETQQNQSSEPVTNLDLFKCVVAIALHFVNLGVTVNVAVRYFLEEMMAEFVLTLTCIIVPATTNTAVWIGRYPQDEGPVPNEIIKRKWFRIIMVVLQMSTILKLIYALKSWQAGRNQDTTAQREYQLLMRKGNDDEDSDKGLLLVFKCFLEVAPQEVLQTTCLLLLADDDRLSAVHQILPIASSLLAMGTCLIQFAQRDQPNMTWRPMAKTVSHILVSLSRITSLSIIAYFNPHWLILVPSCLHIFIAVILIRRYYETRPFQDHLLADIAFSLALGFIYIFTYVWPVNETTKRYFLYHIICFIQNLVCDCIWCLCVDDKIKKSVYFYPVLTFTVVPFLLGIVVMFIDYKIGHYESSQINDHAERAINSCELPEEPSNSSPLMEGDPEL